MHPHVAFSVAYSDQPVGLIEDGFDLNVRVGWLDDSSMMSRKLADGQMYLVAGTEYAGRRKPPKRPGDLKDWDWIHFQQRADTVEFTSPKGAIEKVTGNAQIEVDSVDAPYHFATQNIGVRSCPPSLQNVALQRASWCG